MSTPQCPEQEDNLVSRRQVLITATAIGSGIAVASAIGTGFAHATTQQPNAATAQNATHTSHSAAVTSRKATVTQSVSAPDVPSLQGWHVRPFAMSDVSVTSGIFTRAKDSMIALAQAYPVDQLLACFRTNAGLDDKGATPAGGWENYPKNNRDLARKQSWGPREYHRGQNQDSADGLLRGHYTGHFLSMLAQAYASTQDATILRKINELVSGLKECRDALAAQTYQGQPRYSHPGFLAAYGEWQFSALEEYAPYGEIWAPWYTEHKILAGLIACYEFAGNTDALELAEGIGHWTYSRLSALPNSQLQKMWDIYIGGEFGGMNEALLDLYTISHDPQKQEFLVASHCFDTDKLIENCANGIDILDGLHANQHLPQFVGYAKDAAIGEHTTGSGKEADFLATTRGLWNMIVPGRMYAHGGTGEGEMWGPAHTVAGDIGNRNAESCCAYNMLKIARYLFFMDPKPEYMDYYERTVLNHILGGKDRSIDSAKELSPGNCYMYPVNPGTFKEYGDGNVGTCCGGTALESHSKYQDSIYFHSADNTSLYVNLFIPSTLTWKDHNFALTQETDYPEGETTTLTITKANAIKLTIRIRIPQWAKGASLTVNGKAVEDLNITSGTYVALTRTWNTGDTIRLTIPLQLRCEATTDRADIQALFYGPTVLNALNPSSRFIARGFAERLGLDGTIKLGVTKVAGTANSFIIGKDTFEPAYNGNNEKYHMYFQRKDTNVGFAGSTTTVVNPTKPAQGDTAASTLMDDIWSAAPFADRKAFIAQVIAKTAEYQKAGLLSGRDRQTILLAATRAKMR